MGLVTARTRRAARRSTGRRDACLRVHGLDESHARGAVRLHIERPIQIALGLVDADEKAIRLSVGVEHAGRALRASARVIRTAGDAAIASLERQATLTRLGAVGVIQAGSPDASSDGFGPSRPGARARCERASQRDEARPLACRSRRQDHHSPPRVRDYPRCAEDSSGQRKDHSKTIFFYGARSTIEARSSPWAQRVPSTLASPRSFHTFERWCTTST